MDTVFEAIGACFPRAAGYARRGGAVCRGATVREPAERFRAFPYSERHLQCVWGDPVLRPAVLTSHRGETVAVENPGVWNLEAGPDFLGAALRIGKQARRVAGDVEIHVHPSDWQAHGHGTDANYARVIAHVTYFNSPLPDTVLPPGCVQIALREALAANPLFAFDNIDTTAYPYAARADIPPCSVELAGWSPQEKLRLLDSAGEERLRRRAERYAEAIAERGAEQVLYEEVMTALGYKNNKSPFRRLAEIVRLGDLRRSAAGHPLAAYALLAGVAGLLPEGLRDDWDAPTRRFVRELWDEWWRREDAWADQVLGREHWRLSGLRPTNHPLRRLMAAAQLFAGADPMAWLERGPAEFDEGLQRLRDPYWSFREGLGGKRKARPVQLIGGERADAIAVNVVAPFLAATGGRARFDRGLLERLPVEGSNAILRQTARHLFGPDHPAKLFDTALRRQGLLQIFHDYCLNDRSRCATCRFPALLRSFHEEMKNDPTDSRHRLE